MVLHFGESSRTSGLEKAAIQRLPGFGTRPLNPDRSASSMKITVRVAVIF
jgi:hypothetical protein